MRPVSDSESRAIPNSWTEIAGINLAPGDLIEVEVGNPMPLPHHPEDIALIGSLTLLKKSALLDFVSLIKCELSKPNQLLDNPEDRIAISEIQKEPMRNSLALTLGTEVKFFEKGFGRKGVRFTSGDANWSLSQTDDKRENLNPLAEALICISLAEPYVKTSAHHKLAAGIMSFSKKELEFAISSGFPKMDESHLPLPDLAFLISGNIIEIAPDDRLQGKRWFRQTNVELNCLRCNQVGLQVLRSHEIKETSKGSVVLHRFALLCLDCRYIFSTPIDKSGYGSRLREAVEKKIPVKTACSICSECS